MHAELSPQVAHGAKEGGDGKQDAADAVVAGNHGHAGRGGDEGVAEGLGGGGIAALRRVRRVVTGRGDRDDASGLGSKRGTRGDRAAARGARSREARRARERTGGRTGRTSSACRGVRVSDDDPLRPTRICPAWHASSVPITPGLKLMAENLSAASAPRSRALPNAPPLAPSASRAHVRRGRPARAPRPRSSFSRPPRRLSRGPSRRTFQGFRRQSALAAFHLPRRRQTAVVAAAGADAPAAEEQKKKVLIPIADGSEEIEAVTVIDVLRRAGAEVVVMSVEDDRNEVVCSRGVRIVADKNVKELAGRGAPADWDLIAVPGGIPGAERIADHIKFHAVLEKHFRAGKLMAAICAAPAVCFEPKGFLEGYAATAHPAFVDELGGSLLEKNMYADCRVVVDKQIVTSRGPGTSMEWALCLVEQLYGGTRRRKWRDRWWCSPQTRGCEEIWSGASTRARWRRSRGDGDAREKKGGRKRARRSSAWAIPVGPESWGCIGLVETQNLALRQLARADDERSANSTEII